MKYKQIYLARRHSALSSEQFADVWQQHSELAARFASSMGSHFESVRQCVKVQDADVSTDYQNAHDGCALLAMKSREDLWAARNHPRALNEMKADEEHVFADYVANWTMACEAHEIEGHGDGDFALIWFLARRPEVDEAAFASGLLEDYAPALAKRAGGQGCRRAVVNVVIEKKVAPYDFGAVVELWFGTAIAARDAARSGDLCSAAADLSALVDPARSISMLTRVNFEKQLVRAADGAVHWDVKSRRPN